MQSVTGAAMKWAFVPEDVTAENGEVQTVLRPSPALKGLMAQVAPLLIQQAIAWAKANVKIGKPGEGGGGPGQIDPTALIGMVPKKFQPIAMLFMPKIQQWLGGSGTEKKSSGTTTGNPFMEGKT